MADTMFEVTFYEECDGSPDEDPFVTKIVRAENEASAIEAARLLVATENPEINYVKVWARSVQHNFVQ